MTILWAFALGGGMYFSRIDEKFLGSTFTNSVQSQTIKITPKATTPEEKEKILKRIEAIKKEILSEIKKTSAEDMIIVSDPQCHVGYQYNEYSENKGAAVY